MNVAHVGYIKNAYLLISTLSLIGDGDIYFLLLGFLYIFFLIFLDFLCHFHLH